MGLDLKLLLPAENGHASSSYGGFAHFRKRLAKDGLGIDLDEMEGFGGERSWDEFGPDPLVKLLNHSDCEGRLEGWECEGLGARIRGIVSQWPATEIDYERKYGLQLAEMFDRAYEKYGVVEFR